MSPQPLRAIRPTRAAPRSRELPVFGRPPVEQGKVPARQGGAERSVSRHHRAARSSSQSPAPAQLRRARPRLSASGKRPAGLYFRPPLVLAYRPPDPHEAQQPRHGLEDGMFAGTTVWLNWSDSAAEPYEEEPEARGSPEAPFSVLPFDHCWGTAMSEESRSDRVGHLARLAIGCLLLTLNAPLSGQTPPPGPTDSPSAATSTATATPGPTPGAVTPAPLRPGGE
jgi:hypothetical protein